MDYKQAVFEVSIGKPMFAERQDNLVEGPFSEVQWGRLLDLAKLNVVVLAKRFDISEAYFELRHGFRESGNCFSPCVRVYLLKEDFPLSLEAVGQLLFATACEIVPKMGRHVNLLPYVDVGVEVVANGPLAEFLAKYGGKRIADEMLITVQTQTVVQIAGVYASRPADEVVCHEPVRVVAIVDNVCVSNRIACLYVVDDGSKGGKLSINYSDDFLQPLAVALGQQCLVSVVYCESLDGKGVRFLNLLRLEVAGVSGFELTPSP